MLPAHGAWREVGWVWFCFAIEIFALFDAFILYLTFLRSSDRRAEADSHEARLRALSPDQLPSVDVYIPTYNEPFEVLEKTITGALCLDYPNVRLWVLDDGRRPWLKAFCEAKGIGYLTRPDNAHAKAGNINHALTKTDGDFVAVFDADFVPQRNFLMRTIGFFDDPRIGIVQVPHAFYNHDPMQANLALRKSMPDDQRFFFEAIMPSRDAWDAAFCCGSNSVTRRAALRCIGDALPTTSITEDMLLSLALLRNGYITRYLCERLAYRPGAGNLARVFCATSALGARRHADLIPGGGAAWAKSDFDATAAVSADALAVAKSDAVDHGRRAHRVYVDRYTAAGECDRGGNHLLLAADGAGGRRRHMWSTRPGSISQSPHRCLGYFKASRFCPRC